MTNGNDDTFIDRLRMYLKEITKVASKLGTTEESSAIGGLTLMVSELRAVNYQLSVSGSSDPVELLAGAPPENQDIIRKTMPGQETITPNFSRELVLSNACKKLIEAAKVLSQLPST